MASHLSYSVGKRQRSVLIGELKRMLKTDTLTRQERLKLLKMLAEAEQAHDQRVVHRLALLQEKNRVKVKAEEELGTVPSAAGISKRMESCADQLTDQRDTKHPS